jgi:uncharacterized protein with FMN-binding domain
MKKLLLSSFVMLSFIYYSLGQRNAAANIPTTPGKKTVPNNSGNISASSSSSSSQSNGIYKDGSYTGSVADAFYGNIQVKAVIQNGKISDVQFLQYPNDRERSIMINTQAMPYLKDEAIQAQSAQVDIVSGATDSSQAFIQSLSSALAKAQ